VLEGQRLLVGRIRLAASRAIGFIRRCSARGAPGARHPFKDVCPEPPNVPSTKLLFSRKLPNCGHGAEHPGRSPDEPGYIMGGENMIPIRVRFVHPPGD
jgi:hypothetical protein